MRYLLIVSAVVLTCSVLASDGKDNKVKIAVYYESLCPDSRQFIREQLAPVWHKLRGAVKVKLVPYGKSTRDKKDGKWQFNCHHGPDECYGNKMQACILKDRGLMDTEKMDLVVCLMGESKPDVGFGTCLNQYNKTSEMPKLSSCIDSQQGDNILANYGEKTDALLKPLTFVPTVVINEIQSTLKAFPSSTIDNIHPEDNLIAADSGEKTEALIKPLTIESIVTSTVSTVNTTKSSPIVSLSSTLVPMDEDSLVNMITNYKEETGTTLLETPTPAPTLLPTIVINEKFDQALQDEALKDLMTVVCRVAVSRPAGCPVL